MTLPDLQGLLAALARAEVDHVVIGGIAVGLHGYVRATGAERYDVGGLVLGVASPRQLIAMKEARDSAQDRADVEALRELPER